MNKIQLIPSIKLSNGSEIFNGDNLHVLKSLSDNSIDSIVTDPPYHLTPIIKRLRKQNATPRNYEPDEIFQRRSKGFLGNKWDGGDTAFRTEIWKECIRVLKPGGYLLAFSHSRTYHRLATAIENAGFEIRDQIMWIYSQGFPKSHNVGNGWGTALKPAHEPIVMARKPLSEITINQNIKTWGTGAINIKECRIGNDTIITNGYGTNGFVATKYFKPEIHKGRFPSNVILSDQVSKEAEKNKKGISKFYYCPKATRKDRGEGNNHPTVKPLKLMQYLVRLVTPKGGCVLDIYFGSGSTGKACILEGFKVIGIEKEAKYFNISVKRCQEELQMFQSNLEAA